MPNSPQLLEFDFEARMDIIEPNEEPAQLIPGQPGATVLSIPGFTTENTDDLVAELNQRSDKIARDLQQQLRLALPPRVRVEADIQFYKGSLTAIGSVILLFLQPIVVEAGKKVLEKSLEEGFSRIIQFAVRRVMSAHTRGVRLRSPMVIDVQPSTEPVRNVSTTEERSGNSGDIQDTMLRVVLPLTAANTALLLVLIILLASGLLSSLP